MRATDPRPDSNGFLFVLEGPDGTGKSTQAHMLARQLRHRGYKVFLSSEPTNQFTNLPGAEVLVSTVDVYTKTR